MHSSIKEIPLVWLAASTCTGCTVSLLNSAAPTIKNILIDPIVPGVHINLRFHQTIMGGAGTKAVKVLKQISAEKKGHFVLVVSGAIPCGDTANYCLMADDDGKPVTAEARFEKLARDAMVILATGTCGSFGGIAAAAPNPSGAQPLKKVLESKGIDKFLINIPGCPPHPDWFVGTLTRILLSGLPKKDDLDHFLRPKAFYGKLIHEHCPLHAYFEKSKFARKPGEEGCLYELGCKGPITYADCPTRRWNSGTNWVIGAGAPCQGCTQPEFPDLLAPCYEKLTDVDLPEIGTSKPSSSE